MLSLQTISPPLMHPLFPPRAPLPPPPMSPQGVFLTKEKLQPYFDGGVRRVVVSAPVKEVNKHWLSGR